MSVKAPSGGSSSHTQLPTLHRAALQTTTALGGDEARHSRTNLWAGSVAALKQWGWQQWTRAAVVSTAVALAIGVSTVLIPNGWFSREIATEPWDYPVWLVISVLTGMLAATYIDNESQEVRPARFGAVGAVFGWFAVGCPVCNKIALVALGYSGALRWFAPAQPVLAALAIVISGLALAMRLRGQLWCPTPSATPLGGSQNPGESGGSGSGLHVP